MKEYAVSFGREQSLVGILSENGGADANAQDDPTGVLLLNAGLIHRIGPNRIYVKMARLLASLGFVVFRFDFSGIGDSGPRKDKLSVAESRTDEMRQAMDYLERSRGVRRFFCIGFCEGATRAGQIMLVDDRVKKAVLVNPPVPESPQKEGMALSSYYRKRALRNPYSWLKLFSGRSSYNSVWKALSMEIKALLELYRLQNRQVSDAAIALNQFFRILRMRSVQLLMVFSESDFGDRYLREVVGDQFQKMQDSGLLTIEKLDKTDHSVTPLDSQERLLGLISTWGRRKE